MWLLKCWYSTGNDLVLPYIIRMPTVTASRVDKLRPIFQGIYPLQVEWLEKEITSAAKLIHNLFHWNTWSQHWLGVRYITNTERSVVCSGTAVLFHRDPSSLSTWQMEVCKTHAISANTRPHLSPTANGRTPTDKKGSWPQALKK